jgi:hypothetical protein
LLVAAHRISQLGSLGADAFQQVIIRGDERVDPFLFELPGELVQRDPEFRESPY